MRLISRIDRFDWLFNRLADILFHYTRILASRNHSYNKDTADRLKANRRSMQPVRLCGRLLSRSRDSSRRFPLPPSPLLFLSPPTRSPESFPEVPEIIGRFFCHPAAFPSLPFLAFSSDLLFF